MMWSQPTFCSYRGMVGNCYPFVRRFRRSVSLFPIKPSFHIVYLQQAELYRTYLKMLSASKLTSSFKGSPTGGPSSNPC